MFAKVSYTVVAAAACLTVLLMNKYVSSYMYTGAPIYQPGERVSASTSVVSRFLSTGYLW